MPNIYELTGEVLRLGAALQDDLTQDEFDAVLKEYDASREDLAGKLDGYARLIKNLDGDVTALKAEERRIADNRKALENRVDRLREAVRSAMIATGERKVKVGIGTWSLQKGRPCVMVMDEAKVPDEYKIVQAPTLDRTKMLMELKEGVIIEGAELGEGAEPLVFR